MKGYFAKLKDFSPKLKVSEILLFLMPQNRLKKACFTHFNTYPVPKRQKIWSNLRDTRILSGTPSTYTQYGLQEIVLQEIVLGFFRK